MSRIVKKCYIIFILIAGLSFWAVVKNFPESPAVENSFRGARQSLTEQLNKLDGELASQSVHSSRLLNKIKDKFLNPKDSSHIDGEKQKIPEDKLVEIRDNLEQPVHPGSGEDLGDGHQGESHNGESDVVDKDSVIAVLVFVCNRPTIKRSLDSLLKYRPSKTQFPIVVSQDCGHHAATTDVLKSYGDLFTHINQPDLSEIVVPPKEKKLQGYYKIARHYGWALNYTFNRLNYSNVLVVEDDLEVAVDFFEYFSATLPILRQDNTLWCVSAWNDNGKLKRINRTAPELLHRTDFFPGLGWMLTKDLWSELMVKWPKSYWDDWMREPAQRKDRACIRPEISRTSTFGKNGVSQGTYYQNHLRFIKLNDQFVPFRSMDLSYLKKDKYDMVFVRKVYSSQIVQSINELQQLITPDTPITTEFRLTYRTREGFKSLAKKLEIMEDFRAGVPRTAYRGVVQFMFNQRKVYLAPGANWIGYQ